MNGVFTGDRFFHDLCRHNGLKDPGWFFYTGMLFGREEKWWGRGGTRPGPHEGLDICFYKNNDNELCKLNGDVKIPVMDDGHIYAFSNDDFIDTSIYVRHDARDSNGLVLHSIYAHATPEKGLSPGDSIKKGDVVARMGDPRKRGLKIPSHIHVSLVYLPEDFSHDLLKWQILALSYDVRLLDPFAYLSCEYSEMPYSPELS